MISKNFVYPKKLPCPFVYDGYADFFLGTGYGYAINCIFWNTALTGVNATLEFTSTEFGFLVNYSLAVV